MDNANSDDVQLQFANKATVLTEYFSQDDEGKYYDIFDKTILIPEGSDQNINQYYQFKIKTFVDENGYLPQLPDINSLAQELIQRKLEFVRKNIDIDNKMYRNPFKPTETITYTNNPEREIPEFIRNIVDGMIKELANNGVIDVSPVPIQFPPNFVFLGTPLQENTIDSTNLNNLDNQTKDPQNFSDLPPQIDSNKFLPSFLKAGDATNPNTRLAYYYLKMRDYSRTLRRLMGLVRFYQGNEKEHTFVNMKAETTELNHIYSTMHGKNGDEKDRLKRCMNIEEIQTYKRIKKSNV